MKKIILLFFIVFTVGASYAQEKGFSWGALGSSGNMGKDFSIMKLETFIGYNLTSDFAVYGKAESNYTLPQKNEQLTPSHISQALGLNLKYNLYKFNSGIFDIRAGAGSSILNKDWKYLFYDLGLYLQATRDYTKPTIGIGFRYYDMQNQGSKDYPSVFVSIGFTVN